MKRKILIIFIGICILFPCSARADNQILRNIKLLYVEAQESVNKVIKYYELSQHILQEVSRARENLKNLRSYAWAYLKSQAMMYVGSLVNQLAQTGIYFLNTRMDGFTIPGIKENLKFGDVVTVALEGNLAAKYLKQTSDENDIQEAVALNIRNNNLRVENAARMFANALVNRYNLQDKIKQNPTEDVNGDDSGKSPNPEDQCNGSMSDLPTVIDCYKQLNRTSNHRWVNIIAAMAEYNDLMAQSEITLLPTDNAIEVLGIAEEDVAEGGSLATLRKIKNTAKNVTKNVKSGNIIGALGTTAGFAGENIALKNLSSIAIGIQSSVGVFHGLQTGDWGAALSAAGKGAGNIIGIQGNHVLGDIFTSTAGYAGGAAYAIQNGDYMGALSTAAAGAGAGIMSTTIGKDPSSDSAMKANELAGMISYGGQAAATAAKTVQHGIQNDKNIFQIGNDLAHNSYLQQNIKAVGNYAVSAAERKRAEKQAAEHE
ncbi:MAG: hypothetical protein IJ778_03415, partial [Alphaproteobacteria bacterium]|nr:hypothetical protein [Alphaproteobacteria bacterium]